MDADVIVVGAGPVGLLLACELARSGVAVLVVDKLDQPSDALKGNGIVGRVVPMLKRRGYLRGERVLVAPTYQFGPIPLRLWRRGAGRLHIAPIPQRRLEELLAQRATERGVKFRRGFDCDQLAQDADGVTISAAGEHLTARYAVGCDGARSTVRKALGIDFAGYTNERESLIARVILPQVEASVVGDDLRIGDARLALFRQNSTGRGAVTIAPARRLDAAAPIDEYVLAITRRRAEGGDEPSVEELRAAAAEVLGYPLPMASAHSVRRDVANSRQAERYREGRVFLAGDAAHIFNSGGSSLNVGMLDALDLASRIAAVLRHRAPEAELERYEAMRHPAGARAIEQTRAQSALGAIDPMSTALRTVLTAALERRNPQRYLRELLEGM